MEYRFKKESDLLLHFKVKDNIGAGANGQVYLGLLGDKPVAIKIVKANKAAQELNNTRYIRDVRKTAPLSIAEFLPDIFKLGYLCDGRGYIVMEALDALSKMARDKLFLPLYERKCIEQKECLERPCFTRAVEADLVTSGYEKNIAAATASAAVGTLKKFKISEQYDPILVKKVCSGAAFSLGRSINAAIYADMMAAANNAVTRISEACSIPWKRGGIHLYDDAGKEIVSNLEWLASYGVAWSDLHDGNILSRNNRPVLIDFGEYEVSLSNDAIIN